MVLSHFGRRLGLVLQMVPRTAIEATLMLVAGYFAMGCGPRPSAFLSSKRRAVLGYAWVGRVDDAGCSRPWLESFCAVLSISIPPVAKSSSGSLDCGAYLASEGASPLSLHAPASKPQIAHWKERLAQVINTAYAGSQL
jgi:hypothetical protein